MTTTQPQVSIIVPVFNTEAYLSECLSSLTGQTLKEIEIICVDDGSTDGSGNLLDSWAAGDQRVRVFHRENSGVSASRNFALEKARGEFILFVDSDDFIERFACERLVRTAQEDHSDIVVFGGLTFPSVAWIDNCLATTRAVFSDGVKALFEGRGSYPLMCNKMYRRSLIEENGLRFNSELSLGEDNAFQFMAFPFARKISFSADMLYHYRCDREGSAIATFYSDRMPKLNKHLAVVSYVVRSWSEKGLSKTYGKQLLSWIISFLFDDLQFVSFGDRISFADKLNKLLTRFGLDQLIAELEPGEQEVAHFILAHQEMGASTSISIVLTCCPDEDVAERSFTSLANQSEQRLEIIVVPGRYGKRRAERWQRLDPRIVIADSVSGAIAAARSPWVLQTRDNAVFQWGALRELEEVGERFHADVVACPDSTGLLRCRDIARVVETNMGCLLTTVGQAEPDGPIAFEPSMASDLLFQSVSLASTNKLVRRDLMIRSHVDSMNECGVGVCLAKASRVCFTPRRLMGFCSYTFDTSWINGLFSTGFEPFTLLDATFSSEVNVRQREIDNAVLTKLMAEYRLMKANSNKGEFIKRAKQLIEQRGLLTAHDAGYYFDQDDYSDALEMVQRDTEDYVAFEIDARIERLGECIASVESAIGEKDRELHYVYGSTSLKVGLKVTAPLRWMVRQAKSLLRR